MLAWLQALILESTCSIHITTCKTLPMAAQALQELASLVEMYPVMLHGLAAHIHLLAGAAAACAGVPTICRGCLAAAGSLSAHAPQISWSAPALMV